MGEVKFRKAVLEDAGSLSIFAARTFYETFVGTATEEDLRASMDEAFGISQQQREIEDPRASIILSARDGVLVAFAHYTNREAHSVELNRIYLAQEMKGTGLAQQLLAQVVEDCHHKGVRRLWLSVWHANARAIAFYRRNGFGQVGETAFDWGEGQEVGYTMERLAPFR